MSVEEFLNRELAYQSLIVEAKYEAQIECLKTNFQKTKEALWQTHDDLLAGILKENDSHSSSSESNNHLKKKPTKAARKPAHQTLCGRVVDTGLPIVRVKCIASLEPYLEHMVGKQWVIQPVLNKPCKVGRSKNAHFTNKGISLSEDLEVSTTHGEFGISKETGKLYFKDLGSSNGSYEVASKHKELQINPKIEHELLPGSVLRLGGCLYEVTLS